MDEYEPLSEKAQELHSETFRAWFFGNFEEGVRLIDDALQSGHSFSAKEAEMLHNVRQRYTEVLDPNYMPPDLPTWDQAFRLHEKARYWWHQKRPDEAFRYSWLYVRFNTPGSNAFLDALSDLVGIASALRDDNLCLRATQALFAMNDLMHAVADQQKGLAEAGLPRERPTLLMEEGHYEKPSLPAWEAIDMLERAPDPCWLRVLETTLYEDEHGTKMHNATRDALHHYYSNMGDSDNMSRIERDFPREEA